MISHFKINATIPLKSTEKQKQSGKDHHQHLKMNVFLLEESKNNKNKRINQFHLKCF